MNKQQLRNNSDAGYTTPETLDITTQVHLAESILNIAQRAAASRDRETLSDLGKLLVPLLTYLEDAEISFIDLTEYMGYLGNIDVKSNNSLPDPEATEQRQYLEDRSLKSRRGIKKDIKRTRDNFKWLFADEQ